MQKYTSKTIWVHWLSAVLIIGMMITGMSMEDAPNDLTKVRNLQIHVSLGVLVGLFSAYRVRLYSVEKRLGIYPELLDTQSVWKNRLQNITHFVLRNMLIGLTITGFLALFLSNLLPVVMEGSLPAYENYQSSGVNIAHAILSKIYLLLFIVHIVGVVQYGLLKRANVFQRIS